MVCKNGGVTLLETVIALVVLQIGILGTLALFGVVFNQNRYSQDYTTAVTLAEDEIERLRATGFASLSNGTYSDPSNPVDSLGNAGGGFVRTWTITPYLGSSNIKAVSVTVSWNQGANSITLDATVGSSA